MPSTASEAAQLRDRLGERRRELEQLLDRVRDNIARGLDPDARERAKELEDADVVDTLGNEAVGELMLIRATLARLDSGRYGTCEHCESGIDTARLSAYPYASLCIECARDEERVQRRA